ncbi:MAG: exonuclease domain-containing protein [Flavobacteriales bacterium]
MEFVTLDFETANKNRNSPCEIGLTFVSEGKVVETKSWLIRPKPMEFDYFNVLLHGIRADMVADQPEFDEIWKEVSPLVDGQLLVAHNAGFDMGVLRRTLELYDLPFPSLNYACSYIFSKKVWGGLPAYDLKSLCALNGIPLDHHRAGPDSMATAQLALRAFELGGVAAIEDLPSKLHTTVGSLFNGGYKPSETRRQSNHWQRDLSTIVGDPTKHNPESIFYGRTVVFTGALSSMTRSEAQQVIVDIGGSIAGGVTKATDYLVVGQQDYRLVGDDGMSTKQEKAVKLTAGGAAIEIVSEADFLKNI